MEFSQNVMIFGNTLMLLVFIWMGIRLARASSKFNFAIGQNDKLNFYKRRILLMIVSMALLGFTAAIFNIILAPL